MNKQIESPMDRFDTEVQRRAYDAPEIHTMRYRDFLSFGYEKWAWEGTRHADPLVRIASRTWLRGWRGYYNTPAAIEAWQETGASWAVEWSTRLWLTRIREAQEAGQEIPPGVLADMELVKRGERP